MHTQSSSSTTATDFALALRNPRSRRILHNVNVHLDRGGVWRVSRLTDLKHRVDWYPQLRQLALDADIMSDREKEIWSFNLAQSRSFTPGQGILAIYNRLLSENVRAIITNKSGRVQTPKVDDIVSLEFRPAPGTRQHFKTTPLFERLVINTVTTEPGR